MSASRTGSKESKDSKLPALLTPASPTSTTGYKQSPPSSSPSYGGGKLKSNHPQAGSLPHLPPSSARGAEAEEELPATAQLSHSTSKAALDQLFAELVDPLNKGVVGYKDFSWLHTRLMFYNGRPTSITDRLQSLGGTYPQQVFRKFDLNQDTLLDKAEWQEYANSLVSVLGRAYLKDACKGLLREQQEQESKKVAGATAWRFDDQASRQLLEKVSCAQHLGHEHEEVIEGLLRKFADPNQVDRLGNSVLWHAASKSEVGCMSRLLEHGGSASHAGQHMDSPILAAARARKLQVLRLLMLGDLGENGIDSEETTLHSQQLIDKASELTAKDARELFMKGASVNYRNDRGWSPLTAAVFWNNHEYVECLIKLPHKCPRTALQADLPDSRGRTALHVAARKGLTDLVPLILGSRANPNARDSDGWTALHHAVFNGHSETVMKLLDGQADPKADILSFVHARADGGLVSWLMARPKREGGVRGFSWKPRVDPPSPPPSVPDLGDLTEPVPFLDEVPCQQLLEGIDLAQAQQLYNSLTEEQKEPGQKFMTDAYSRVRHSDPESPIHVLSECGDSRCGAHRLHHPEVRSRFRTFLTKTVRKSSKDLSLSIPACG
eukprot:s549_g15.t1